MNEQHRAENDLGHLILRLANTIIKNRNRHLQAIDLTASQADSLQFFLAREGSSITDLKDYMGITHQTARGIVQRIAAKGLVELHRSEEDARRQIVVPTQAGRRLGDQMTRNRERTVGKLLQNMDQRERADFVRLLRLAYENVKDD